MNFVGHKVCLSVSRCTNCSVVARTLSVSIPLSESHSQSHSHSQKKVFTKHSPYHHVSSQSIKSLLKCKSTHVQQRLYSTVQDRLMEFFDTEKNWKKLNIPVGRSWEKAELRTRNNQELHKLWYILLKEMNMLLTMKAEYDRLCVSMPAVERLEKVEVSMDNLRDVVDERDTSLSLLETGEPPHPKWIDDTDELDRPVRRLEEEHIVPREHNADFLKKYENLGDWTREFKRHWNEKQTKHYTANLFKSKRLAKKLLEKYPHLAEDREFLDQYCREKIFPNEPNPDVEKLIEESNKD